jgi:Up-frameshift suppressor 2
VDAENDAENEDEALFHRNVEPEVDKEFNREFSRVMSEALESRKGASKPVFDVEPPSVRTRLLTNSGETSADPSRVQFGILSRRGKQVNSAPCNSLITDENC